MISDTVLGLDPARTRRAGARGPTGPRDTVVVALSEIARLDVEKGSSTAVGILAGVGLLAAVVALAAGAALGNADMGVGP